MINYTVLCFTIIIICILKLKSIWDKISKSHPAHRKQANDIGEEAWRLLMQQHHGESHTSEIYKGRR